MDRRRHVINEFTNKNEFDLQIERPVKDYNGAKSLWMTIKRIVRENIHEDYIAICEDDHEFTIHYSYEELSNIISKVDNLNGDILSGGISWVQSPIRAEASIYWIDKFTGTQFIIIFKRFYAKILNSKYKKGDTADSKICDLSERKFVIFPFISIQKWFGYSDVTMLNNKKDRVRQLFIKSSKNFEILNYVSKYYVSEIKGIFNNIDIENIAIPTYIISNPERKDGLNHIKRQFLGRTEFDLKIIRARKNEVGALGIWKTIRRIINIAIYNDDDVIVIAEDNHIFTRNYSKQYFLSNVIEANQQNIDYLSGGTSGFSHAIRVANNRFWVHPCLSTQFIVVYKRFFEKIIHEPYNQTSVADLKLSEITSNKMVLFPFISFQKNFKYSGVEVMRDELLRGISQEFSKTQKRLKKINEMTLYFGNVASS